MIGGDAVAGTLVKIFVVILVIMGMISLGIDLYTGKLPL